jgi:hypothetical protein
MDVIKTYVIPAFVILGLLLIWDFGKPGMRGVRPLEPSDSLPTFHAVQSPLARGSKDIPQEAIGDGVPPNNADENIYQNNRGNIRTSTMKSLEQAWSTYCTREGRFRLAQALNNYFEQSSNQIESYSNRWGKEGRDYIKAQWSTTDDHRIERLVSDTYERGYLDVASLSRTTASRVAPLLKDVRVQGQPCKG